MAEFELKSEVTGSIWKIVTEVGQSLDEGDTVMIIESMKMEIPVLAERKGTLGRLLVSETDAVSEGQIVAIIAD